MAGHARLKFVMTECSKTQIRLTGLILRLYKASIKLLFSVSIVYPVFAVRFNFEKLQHSNLSQFNFPYTDGSISVEVQMNPMETLCLISADSMGVNKGEENQNTLTGKL